MVFVDFNTCFTEPKQFIRLIVLIACICVTFYELEGCVLKLLHPPISSSTKLMLNKTVKFPAVTICKKPAYKTYLFPKYGLKKRTEVSNKGAFSTFDFGNYTIYDFMEETTYLLNETVPLYSFGPDIPTTNFTTNSTFYLKLGRCHSFRTDYRVSKFSMDGGMYFLLQGLDGFHSSRDPPTAVTASSVSSSSDDGFNVFIHDTAETITDEVDQIDTFSQLVAVQPRETVYLTVEVREFHLVDHSDSPCMTGDNYSQSQCLEKCMDSKLMKKYNCSLPWMIGWKEFPLCNDSNVIDDITSEMNNEKQKFTDSCKCPIPCDLYFYLPKIVSRAPQESTGTGSFLTIYYNSNIVTAVNEIVTYDWISFVADLGGSFGLFLGLSVIGLIEVIEAIFSLLFKKRREKLEQEEREKSLKDQKFVAKLIEHLMRQNDGEFKRY